jgi:hypothetical protein
VNELKAADLPEGSVVASRYNVYIKREGDSWLSTGDDMNTHDWEPQSALDHGAVVLRHGYGDEGER